MDVRSLLARYASVRSRTRAVADCIPENDLERSPAPGRFTPGDLVRHVAATERWMWGENVRLRPSRYAGHGRDLAEGKGAVLRYLDRMQDETAEIIGSLTDDDLSRRCATVAGAEIEVVRWIVLMFEHEIHHRGQLYQILGEWGIRTPPLYGLREREVRARSVE